MPDLPETPRFCTECGSPLPSGAKFCSQCGTPVAAPVAEPGPVTPDAVPGPSIPPELRTKYERAREELRGDRREVVVLFADLSGFTALSERLDPEEVSLIMHGLLGELADVVYRYEGYVDKYIGDAIMALFGAPIAHENDAERAVLAALDMLDVTARRSDESEHLLSIRVGLNQGEVVAAHVGSESRQQYTVMGDTVNVASRLEGAAAPNSVLVSQSVHERIGSRFETEAVDPVTVKGKSKPLKAHRVVRYRPSTPAPQQEATAFVGRDEELALLDSFLHRVVEGAPGTFVIEAEAGAGKSRLVNEALLQADLQLDLLEVEFSPIDLPGSQSVSTDLFGQLITNPDGEMPEDNAIANERAAELLGDDYQTHETGINQLLRQLFQTADDDVAQDIDPGVARQNRWLAVMALLSARARTIPVLIRFEDAHWADETDAEFLGFMMPLIAAYPIGVVVTTRSGASLAWVPKGAERLELRNLDEEAARSILGGFFGTLRSQDRKELIRRSQGNPFYLEELARSLRDAVEPTGSSVPGTIQGLLQSRIDRLDDSVRLLLQMGSVLGATFSVELLGRIYRLERHPVSFEDALEKLEGEGFFELPAADVFGRFRHALMVDVAYGGILGGVRRVLHESAARLGEEHYAERLEAEAPFFAHHFWEASLKADAAPHLWSAGRAAAQNYELHAAERFLNRLSEVLEEDSGVLPESTQRADFMTTYGTVLRERGRFEDGERWFEQLQHLGELEKQEEWIGKALFQRGAIALYRGQIEEAQLFFEQGLARSPTDERATADLHSGMGLVHHFCVDVDRALDEHRKALQLREQAEDRFGYAKSLMNIGNVLLRLQNDPEGARDHYERALVLARENDDREMRCLLLLNLGTLDLELGEYASALVRFEDMQEVAEEIGYSQLRFLSLRNQAACYVRLGHIATALQALKACIQEGDAILDAGNRVAVRILQFEVCFCALDDAGAGKWLREAGELATELKVTEHDDWIALSECRLAAARGEWEVAAAAASRAEELARQQHDVDIATIAAAHQWRASARAGLEVEESCAAADPDPRPSISALVQYLCADGAAARGSLQPAADSLTEAGDVALLVGDLSLALATFQRLAEVLRDLGDESGARVAASRAAEARDSLRKNLPEELLESFDADPRSAVFSELSQ
jgi:class 3 adenylate cyclase/tetratricopeptide (TPR) repeat protein